MSDGLNKDGGISFNRKLKEDEKKPYGLADKKIEEELEAEIPEPKRLDTEELLRQERLNAQLSKAKTINYSGFALNGGSIAGLFFVIDSFVLDPNTLEMLELINTTFNLDIDFQNIITLIQQYKMQLIGVFASFQTFLYGYKDTCQKMVDRDTESFMEVINEELEKVGI